MLINNYFNIYVNNLINKCQILNNDFNRNIRYFNSIHIFFLLKIIPLFKRLIDLISMTYINIFNTQCYF